MFISARSSVMKKKLFLPNIQPRKANLFNEIPKLKWKLNWKIENSSNSYQTPLLFLTSAMLREEPRWTGKNDSVMVQKVEGLSLGLGLLATGGLYQPSRVNGYFLSNGVVVEEGGRETIRQQKESYEPSFLMLCPRYSLPLSITAPTACTLWETFTIIPAVLRYVNVL